MATTTQIDPRTERELDTLLAALAHERRRRLLAVLDDSAARCIESLAAEMARIEVANTGDSLECRPEPRNSIAAALYHVHVPELRDAGLVEYREDSRTVRLTDRGEQVRSLLPITAA